jgi:hypothetical protein
MNIGCLSRLSLSRSQGKWQDREVAIKKLHLTGENSSKLDEFRNESRIMMYVFFSVG